MRTTISSCCYLDNIQSLTAYRPPSFSRLWYPILVSGILGCGSLGCGGLGCGILGYGILGCGILGCGSLGCGSLASTSTLTSTLHLH